MHIDPLVAIGERNQGNQHGHVNEEAKVAGALNMETCTTATRLVTSLTLQQHNNKVAHGSRPAAQQLMITTAQFCIATRQHSSIAQWYRTSRAHACHSSR